MKLVVVVDQDLKIQLMELMDRNHNLFSKKIVVKLFLLINNKYFFKCRNIQI